MRMKMMRKLMKMKMMNKIMRKMMKLMMIIVNISWQRKCTFRIKMILFQLLRNIPFVGIIFMSTVIELGMFAVKSSLPDTNKNPESHILPAWLSIH